MEESVLRLKRREAYGAIRNAVQNYERLPSATSARAVEAACARLRQVGEEAIRLRQGFRRAQRDLMQSRSMRDLERV